LGFTATAVVAGSRERQRMDPESGTKKPRQRDSWICLLARCPAVAASRLIASSLSNP